jgi:hypothetical protein
MVTSPDVNVQIDALIATGVLRRRLAFRGQTPDEMYFGIGDVVPADLKSAAADAGRARRETNRSASCDNCRSAEVAA